jgi:hypothetical protein
MGVQMPGRRPLARRASVMVAIPALVLAIALGGCRASGARNGAGAGNSNVPVTQSTSGTGSSSVTSTGNSGGGSNAALQQIEQLDSQNQTDQQQLGAAGSDASVDYSSQDNSIQP